MINFSYQPAKQQFKKIWGLRKLNAYYHTVNIICYLFKVYGKYTNENKTEGTVISEVFK